MIENGIQDLCQEWPFSEGDRSNIVRKVFTEMFNGELSTLWAMAIPELTEGQVQLAYEIIGLFPFAEFDEIGCQVDVFSHKLLRELHSLMGEL